MKVLRPSVVPSVVALAILLGVVAPGCGKDDDEVVMPPVVVAMMETTPPLYDDGEEQIFQVTRQVPLPYRRFTDAERPRGDQDPYPRPPFHRAADSRVTVRFTLSNLSDQRQNVELLIDPWNEFVRYEPGVSTVGEDELLPNFSGIQRLYTIAPRSRIEGILTPDDFGELAKDLTTAMSLDRRPPDPMGDFGGPALFNRAFNVQNRSSEPDPVLAPYMPPRNFRLAAITGFDVSLRTGAAARLAVELIISVEDLEDDRIVVEGDEGRVLARPGNVLSPPAGAP
ncbi:MAG: hypothetical protein KIT84_05140 [Labilithrix sp.]|nr:hypothetical protein [Labilithrix sp.]MCW5810371.1 hypothetical protein [Labilithrix sp.]